VRTRLLPWLAAAGCVLGLLGCSAPADDPLGPSGGAGGGKADDASGAESSPVLAEAYAMHVRSDVLVRNVDDELVTHTTQVVALARTEQDGSAAHLTIVPCAVDLPAVDFTPTLQPGVIASLQPVLTSAEVYFDPDGRPRMDADPTAIVAGVDLDDPLLDSMPEDPDDDRYFDQDGDDRPGISVSVSAFTVFAAARVLFALTGDIAADGTIEGDADADLDFEILGDTIPFVDARDRAQESAANSEVLSSEHRFSMIPLLDASCEEALGAV
jgi:hypothetical protein